MTRYKPFVFLLFLLALAAGGCSKDGISPAAETGTVDMGLTVSTYASDSNASAQETAVSSAYVFIFNSDGLLENPGRTQVRPNGAGELVDASGRLSGMWKVVAGRKTIYVVLNPHDVVPISGGSISLDDVTSSADLLRLATALSTYRDFYTPDKWATAGGLCMSGSTTVDVSPATPEVVMNVARRYARVDLRVKRGQGFENAQLKVKQALFSDYPMQTLLFAGAGGTSWTSGLGGSNTLSRTFENGGVEITSASEYTDVAQPLFYMMPYPATASGHLPDLGILIEDATGGTEWRTIRFTQLDADGGFDLSRPLEIEANKIYRVEAAIGQHTTGNIKVLPWYDTSLDANLSHTTLAVDKASCTLVQTDTLFVSTNAPSIEVTKNLEAWWLTLHSEQQGEGRWAVRIDADQEYFTTTRSATVIVKAGNLEKRIPVTQKHLDGTVAWSSHTLYLSPVHPTRQADVLSTRGWTLVAAPAVAAASPAAGPAGETAVSFTRSDADGNFGDGRFIVQNDATHDCDTLVVCNLQMDVPETLTLKNKLSDGTYHDTFDGFAIQGGSGRFVVVSKPAWISSATVNADGTLGLVYAADPDEEDREGTLRIAHADDPDYTIDIQLVQGIYIAIPPFHYYVCQFSWTRSDVDIAVEFAGNGVSEIDGKPVGWGKGIMENYGYLQGSKNTSANLTSFVTYKGAHLLEWGGDCTASNAVGGVYRETAFFNAPLIDTVASLPRKLKLEVYAHWYGSPLPTDKTMIFTGYAYEGGTMEDVGTYYVNIGGTEVCPPQEWRVEIPTNSSSAANFRTTYTHVATMTYDRIKHSASIRIHATVVDAATAAAMISAAERTAVADDVPKPAADDKSEQVAK